MSGRWQSILYTLFVGFVIGLVALLVAVQTSLINGVALYIVSSGSMEPTISTGSLVLVREKAEYAVGDIVTFGADRAESIPTTHRIVGERLQDGEFVYEMQGDANEEPDAQLRAPEEIIGQVVFHVPFLGYVLDFARQPLGFVLLIVLPALLVVFEEVSSIRQELRGRRQKAGDETDSTTDQSDDETTPDDQAKAS